MKATQQVERMLDTNARQKAYYEVASGYGETISNNRPTNLYRRLKVRAFSALAATSRAEDVKQLHRQWAGDLRQKSVLDLGCGTGNPLSLEFAGKAGRYLAIDLSESRCATLRARLAEAGAPNATVRAVDFLSPEFGSERFDLIYALSVFHHFAHFDAFLAVVDAKLAPGGRVIIYDPLAIWWPARLLRAALRPVQTDAEWEHPFSRTSLRTLTDHFAVLDCRGLVGRSKWAALAGLVAPAAAARLAQRWHERDMRENTTIEHSLTCLHFAAVLAARDGA